MLSSNLILFQSCLREKKTLIHWLLKIQFSQICSVTGKKEFLDNAAIVFDEKRDEKLRDKLAEERKEKEEYAKKVGQLTLQVDWLKKKSEELLGPEYEDNFSPKPFKD